VPPTVCEQYSVAFPLVVFPELLVVCKLDATCCVELPVPLSEAHCSISAKLSTASGQLFSKLAQSSSPQSYYRSVC
jgi:hypothetical protein